ncbi:MAG: hypothetical protein IKB23_06170, partial [Clostridia bacterium]|nr:hypothetical protein [Clostridia bacterium]
CFGLITKYADATPYATDNHDTPSVFYYKPDGSNSWQSLMTGSDGCIGAKDNCPVKGFKGWLAFPIEYMLGGGGEKLDSQSIITGVYFYYSVADAANTNKYIYLDDISLVEKLDFSVVSDFDGTAPTFSLSGWAGDTSSAVYTNEIKADIIDGVGVNGSKALATKRTVYHSEYFPRSVELRWNTTAPVTVGSSKYFKIWVDFGTNEVEFRKAIFGLMVGDAAKPYTTDNHDTPSEFYYKPDGSDTWQTLYTGNDGCIGEADNCPVKGIKGWLAFPLEYMLGSGHVELTADSLVNGIYFFYSYTDSTYIDRYVYLDEISLVEDYK